MFPGTIDVLVAAYAPIQAGEARLQDLLTGFIDPNAPDEIAPPAPRDVVATDDKDKDDDSDDNSDDSEAEEVVDLGPDPVEAEPTCSPPSQCTTNKSCDRICGRGQGVCVRINSCYSECSCSSAL